MTKLGNDRDTHLTPGEIAIEALRRFDAESAAPSIRQLAADLRVAPSSVYHHFRSRAAILQAAVDLVWAEATVELLRQVPDPFGTDPVEVLVAAGIATRRAFGRHYRIAPYMAATPGPNRTLSDTLALMSDLFEQLGLVGADAGSAFHTYASFTIGAVLFAASRRLANEQLSRTPPPVRPSGRLQTDPSPPGNGSRGQSTRQAIEEMIDVSTTDPARDEELFAEGLRRLIQCFAMPVPD